MNIKKYIMPLFLLTAQLNASFLSSDGGWGNHYNVPKILSVSVIATAAITGNESKFGKTVWKSMDALIISAIATDALKRTFNRVRPADRHLYGGKDTWFKDGNHSFPSGHVSSVAAIVTPFVLEYQDENPWVHALWLLPIHQMLGRYNDNRHHISDVIAGFGVGFISGYIANKMDTPMFLTFTDDGVYGGLSLDF